MGVFTGYTSNSGAVFPQRSEKNTQRRVRRLKNLPVKAGCPAVSASYDTSDSGVSKAILLNAKVQEWNPHEFLKVKTLQEARVNHGSVDLMQSFDQGFFVACKKMPNSWVMESHEDFKRTHTQSAEEPWTDVCVAKYLFEDGFPYVCAQFGVFRDSVNTFVLTSFASGGDLFNWMETAGPVGFEREQMIRPISNQIFTAVRMLHDRGIAHRDLSPENILLSYDGQKGVSVKLIDFGMASLGRFCGKPRGKPSFQAPEMHSANWYDSYLSDAFQLGVVMYALATQDYPWDSTIPGACNKFSFIEAHGLREFLAIREVYQNPSEVLIDAIDPEFLEVVEGLLQFRPEDRLTCGELCWGQDWPDRKSVFHTAWFNNGVFA
eukprot:TRINITY_DN51161_c0_g1_i1.p1 TRINITY_DN51161_c0_g1~~TRINITY_DN51161_c0_g1_i1.p1  ORF type:complete len:377 (-),score=51.72 TRINITY_DN51161_c0_g1_i1:20-1150(-)